MPQRWRILVAAFFGVFVSFSSVFVFTFGVFLKPLSAEFGWTRTQLSAGFALAALTVAGASPVIGRLLDRFGSRAVILPASTIFAVAFASLGWLTPHLAHFYAVLFVLGLVGNGTTQLAFSRSVVQAFDGGRGMALAVMMAGTGVGSMLMPAIAQALIDHWGWRAGFRLLGLAAVSLTLPLTAWLIPGQPRSAAGARRTLAPAALRSPLFLSMVSAFFLMSLAVNAALAHMPALLTDRGLTPQRAALAASALGAATLGGRLLTGWLLDRGNAAAVSAILFGAGSAGLVVLALGGSEVWAFAGAGLIGVGMGAEADVMPYLISRHFDMQWFSELYGYAFSAFALGGALGPVVMGRAFDLTGSYDSVLLGFAAAALGAALLIWRTAASGFRLLRRGSGANRILRRP